MKKLISNPLVRAILLLIALLLSLIFTVQAQTLSGNNGEIVFSVDNDSLYVDSDRYGMMPMLRYEFRFYFDDDKPLSIISNNNRMHGKVVAQIMESDKIRLKRHYIKKIEIYNPAKTKRTITILNDRFYFVKYL